MLGPSLNYLYISGTDNLLGIEVDEVQYVPLCITRSEYFIIYLLISFASSDSFPVPSVPRNLRVQHTSAREVTVEWDVPEPPNGPETDILYLIAWGMRKVSSNTNKANKTQFEATGLKPYTDYEFKVQAESTVGVSDWTSVLEVKTNISSK